MNLQSDIDFDLSKFWRWWMGQLAFLVPEKLKALLQNDVGEVICHALGDVIEIDYRHKESPVLRLPLADYADLRTRQPEVSQARHVLRLASGLALKKFVHLPEAALENLLQVVSYEMDKFTPFKADQVYFTAVPVAKPEQGLVRVLLIVALKSNVDGFLQQLKQVGFQAEQIDCQIVSELDLQGQRYNLLPEALQPRISGFNKLLERALSGLAVCFLLAVLGLPVWQLAGDVDYLQTQLKAVEKRSAVVDQQQRQIDAMRQQTQALADIKSHSPSLLIVLNELSRLLPDATWLSNFQYNERHIQIQGQSPAASNLIGLLEGSPMFENVRFVSPLTQDKATGKERFQISLDSIAVTDISTDAVEGEPTISNKEQADE